MAVSDALYLAGDLSGIQRFVLRVKAAGKAQATRLRARRFSSNSSSALRCITSCNFVISDDDILIRGGGGFLVRLRPNTDHAQLERLEVDLQGMLWDEHFLSGEWLTF